MITKVDFVRKFATDYGYSIKKSAKFINDMMDFIPRCLVEYGGVKIVGFGTLEVKTRQAKKGQNPKTGETIDIPPRKYIKFVAGEPLERAVE